MYCPAHFAESRPEALHALMREHPLATLVTMGEGGLNADHIPLMLETSTDGTLVLRGHVARANPAWALLLAVGAALGAAWTWRLFQGVIFGQPQGDAATATDLRPREVMCVALLAALTLGGGLVPGPLLALTRAPVEAITARLDEAQQRAEARQGEWLVSIGVINDDRPTQN